MAHKIKGWARDFLDYGTGYELGNGGGWAEFSEDGQEEFGDVPCTLVTTHERVFTESEVKRALEEFAIAGDMGRVQAMIIAKRHGIVLDPA